jgi:hypothetical protein
MKKAAPITKDSFKPLLLLALTAFFLWLLSLIPAEVLHINSSLQLRKMNLFSSVETVAKFKPKKHFRIISGQDEPADFSNPGLFVREDSLWIDYSVSKERGIKTFFQKLAGPLKKKKIRIAYFGDSMIEGDLIVRDLRNLLQLKYGGMGVGMVPLTSPTAGFRQTIKHSFSPNWSEYNLLLKTNPIAPGITGHVFIPQINESTDTLQKPGNASWCTFFPVPSPLLNEFSKTSLLYGPTAKRNFVFVNAPSGPSKVVALSGNSVVNKLEIPAELSKKGFTLTFATGEALPLYALNFDSDSGIFVDNFSFRGNSGMPLTRIPFSHLNRVNEIEPYDLIILQYGLNAASASVSDYHWYETGLTQMVNHLKKSFPDAAFLMITPGDKSMKENGEWITDPGLIRVVETEKKVAQKTDITFYNFFQAMGGQNSMVEWAESNPPKANKDYTHFNFRGAALAGKMIFNALEKAKKEYEAAEKIHSSISLPSLP